MCGHTFSTTRKLASSCPSVATRLQQQFLKREDLRDSRHARRYVVQMFAPLPPFPFGAGRRNDDSGTGKRSSEHWSSETPASGGSEQAAEPPSRDLQHRETSGKARNRARERESGRSQDRKHCVPVARGETAQTKGRRCSRKKRPT